MRERVLAIVSLIAQYAMSEVDSLTENDIVEELLSIGFDADEIDAAFGWMHNLTLHRNGNPAEAMTVPAQRIFTPGEIRLLSNEARGFLLRLRALGILDDEIQEDIIERALDSAEDQVGLREIKSLTALTLFARTNDEWRREVDCFMEDDWTRIYH